MGLLEASQFHDFKLSKSDPYPLKYEAPRIVPHHEEVVIILPYNRFLVRQYNTRQKHTYSRHNYHYKTWAQHTLQWFLMARSWPLVGQWVLGPAPPPLLMHDNLTWNDPTGGNENISNPFCNLGAHDLCLHIWNTWECDKQIREFPLTYHISHSSIDFQYPDQLHWTLHLPLIILNHVHAFSFLTVSPCQDFLL